jgi:hypothetical protein
MLQIWFPLHYFCCRNITVNRKEHKSNISSTQCNLLVCYSCMNFCIWYQWCAGFGSYTFPRTVITKSRKCFKQTEYSMKKSNFIKCLSLLQLRVSDHMCALTVLSEKNWTFKWSILVVLNISYNIIYNIYNTVIHKFIFYYIRLDYISSYIFRPNCRAIFRLVFEQLDCTILHSTCSKMYYIHFVLYYSLEKLNVVKHYLQSQLQTFLFEMPNATYYTKNRWIF